MPLNEAHVVNDAGLTAEFNRHSARLNTANFYDLEDDFGAPKDGVSGASDALQAYLDAVAAGNPGKLRTRSRIYVLDKEIVFPQVDISQAALTYEIEGPQAFPTVSFAPGFPMAWDVPPVNTGTIFQSTVAGLLAPVQNAPTTATSGGALAAATYYYKITATFRALETVWSNERSITTTGTTSTVTLSWTQVAGATGYKVYRGTATNTENVLVASVSGGATLTYTDVGGATTAGVPPNQTTAGAAVFGNIAALNNVLFKMKNIIVRCPQNPATHALECGWLTNAEFENVKIDTGGSTGDILAPIQQPTHGTIAFNMPGVGNGGHVVGRNISAEGFAVGIAHSEHCLLDNFTAFKCLVGLRLVKGFHAARHGRISLYWNQVGIQTQKPTTGPVTRAYIDEVDYEETDDTTAWFYTTAHIDDPQNLLRGSLAYHRIVSAQGVVAWLRRNGAAYADTDYLGGFEKGIVDVVGFDGTASATAIPVSMAGSAAVVGLGTWGITGTPKYEGYISTLATTNNVVVWDTGLNQIHLHGKLTTSTGATNRFNTGFAMNYVDSSNYLYVAVTNTTVAIGKLDAGVQSTLASGSRTTGMGEVLDVVIQTRAGRVTVWVNDIQYATYALTAAERTKFYSNTMHGLYAYRSGASYEDGGSRWGFLRMANPGPFSPA